MNIRLLTIAAASVLMLCLASCTEEKDAATGHEYGPIYDGPPPSRYMGDTKAVTHFSSNIARDCGAIGIEVPTGYKIEGCAYRVGTEHHIIVPNPCLTDPKSIICHEIGHVNGWGYNHES